MNKWAYKNAKSGNLNKNWIFFINNILVFFRRIFKRYNIFCVQNDEKTQHLKDKMLNVQKSVKIHYQ